MVGTPLNRSRYDGYSPVSEDSLRERIGGGRPVLDPIRNRPYSSVFQMKNAVHAIPSVVSAKQTCVGYSSFSTEIGALISWFFPSLSWPAMWIKPSPSIQ